MQLKFYKESTVDGIRYQFAFPTEKFWSAWNLDKGILCALGISLTHTHDDLGRTIYTVVRASKPDSNNIPRPIVGSPYLIRDVKGLKDYQIPAVGALVGSLLSNNFALDASDTGTGKTYTGVKTSVITKLQPAVVCTKTNIHDWKKVCEIFNVNPIFICNWESCIGRIHRNNGFITKVTQPPNKYIEMSYHPYTGKPLFRWKIPPNARCLVIFDEMHKANGMDSSSQALVRACQEAGHKILGLSATICDKLEKLRMLGSLIGLFKYDDFKSWLKEKGCYINSYDNWESTNEKELMLKISKYIFPNYGARVRKSEIPGFPPCQNIAKLYKISKQDIQNKEFSDCEKKIAEIEAKKVKGYKFQILALRTKHRQKAEIYKIPLLIDLAKEYVESGHNVVIFTNYVETLTQIIKKLKLNYYITGGQKDAHRMESLRKFGNDEARIIVCNMQAAATGTDGLQDLKGTYPRISLIPPCDDAVLLKQVLGRIHRSNSMSLSINLLVYSMGTIEVKVFNNVHNKIANIDLVNDGDLAESETFKKVA